MRDVPIFSCGSNFLKSAVGGQFPRGRWKKPHRERHCLDGEPSIPMIHVNFPPFSSKSDHLSVYFLKII